MSHRDRKPPSKPQLQIWEEGDRDAPVGALTDDDGEWEARVVLELVAPGHVRGRLSFRQGDRRFDTAPVLVEESEQKVVDRARQLPDSMLHQLLASVRD